MSDEERMEEKFNYFTEGTKNFYSKKYLIATVIESMISTLPNVPQTNIEIFVNNKFNEGE